MNTLADNFPEHVRRALIKVVNDRLADSVDLQLQCKHAYWNTTDPSLKALRELFDELNESLEDYIDQIAERAVGLGGVADSTERVETTWSRMLCSPDANCRNHAPTIAAALTSFGELVRKSIHTTNEFGDVATTELFTELLEGVDNWRGALVPA